jgi:hypothetical protein
LAASPFVARWGNIDGSRRTRTTTRCSEHPYNPGFAHRGDFVRLRVPRPRDAPEDDDDDNTEYLTLLLTVNTLKHSDKMEDAVVRIRSLFREYTSTEHVQIECIDYRVHDSLVSLPIRFDERGIIQQWEAVQSRVLSLLSDHSARWQSLECLRRGLIDDPKECPPTIVISTPTARDPKWFEASSNCTKCM